MSYEVLARKWRPATFEELVGQQHVQRALTNALDEDQLHHAYLFTGTRGVGKTTIARIFAKSLNCETGVSSRPCGKCGSCREIAEGRFIDLIEVDAASRTGVDDTRELLENVQYAPTRGRYKVYLIDEVHMFSKSSFNALLKTLEEPPPHVKFLLATTDPQKLPVTVLSRCLQFNLKRLSIDLILSQLQKIAESGNINFDKAALQMLAQAADGSMRDALSLLDQALAYGNGSVKEIDTREMLGTVSRERVLDVFKALLNRDARKTLEAVQELSELTPDYDNVLSELLSMLHHMALAKKVPEALDDYVSEREILLELCKQISAEDLHLFYQIALSGRRDLPLSPDERTGFEMILLRMLSFRPATTGVQRAEPAPLENVKPVGSNKIESLAEEKNSPVKKKIAPEQDSDWRKIIDSLTINGMVKQLAANCILVSKDNNLIVLNLDNRYKQLHSPKAEKRLQHALSEYFNDDVKLEIRAKDMGSQETEAESNLETPAQSVARETSERQHKAEAAIEGDSFVQAMKKNFNAEIIPGSVRPVDQIEDRNTADNTKHLENEVNQ